MTDSKQKGLVAILLILIAGLIGAGIILFFLNYSQPKRLINNPPQVMKPVSSEPLPTELATQAVQLPKFVESNIDIAKIPNDGRLYLAINLPDESTKKKINVFAKAPNNSEIAYNLTRDNELDIKMKLNEVEYIIQVPLGPSGGICSNEEFGNVCGYEDEEIQTMSLVKINSLRIWKRENKVLLLNPFVITKDNFYISHLVITKTHPNDVFQDQEVNIWRDILKSINFEKVI